MTIQLGAVVIAMVIGGCSTTPGPTSTTPVKPLAAQPTGPKRLAKNFSRDESALFRGVPAESLHCTAKQIAGAALHWLSTYTGKSLDKLKDMDADDLLQLVDQSLKSVEELQTFELADLAWLAATQVQRLKGGRFAWDDKQDEIALFVADDGSQALHHLRLAASAYQGQQNFSQGLGAYKADKSRRPSDNCKGVPTVNVLRGRLKKRRW